MDVYNVTVKANIYILANSCEEAEELAKKELDSIDAFLPALVPAFSFDAYHTPCQDEWLKKQAINNDA